MTKKKESGADPGPEPSLLGEERPKITKIEVEGLTPEKNAAIAKSIEEHLNGADPDSVNQVEEEPEPKVIFRASHYELKIGADKLAEMYEKGLAGNRAKLIKRIRIRSDELAPGVPETKALGKTYQRDCENILQAIADRAVGSRGKPLESFR